MNGLFYIEMLETLSRVYSFSKTEEETILGGDIIGIDKILELRR